VGDTLWTKTYGGNNYEQGLHVIQSADSGFAISGSIYSAGFGGSDALLLKTDTVGNIVFSHCFGSTGDESAPALVQTSDGGYALGAYTNTLTGFNYNCYFVKTDVAGNTNNNCNQQTANLSTTQRAFTITTATTQVTGAPLSLVYIPTNLDSGALQATPCISMAVGEVKENNPILSVYPNPTAGVFTFTADNISSETVTVSVTSILGEKIYNSIIKNVSGKISSEINLSGFPTGTYFLHLQSEGKFISKKLILTR